MTESVNDGYVEKLANKEFIKKTKRKNQKNYNETKRERITITN